jgi:uncharacterized protein
MRAIFRAVATAGFIGFAAAALAAPTFPQLTGRVVDEAGIVPANIEVSLDQKLAALERATTDQFVVVTLASLQGYEIADYGYRLGRAWGIGQQGKDNGVLLIVAPNERDVRIEVGYGLEGDLTDAVTRLIIENAILPKFRDGDYPGGIAAGVDDVIKVLSGDAAAFKEEAAKQPKGFSQDRPGDEGINPFVVFLVLFVIVILVRHFGAGLPFLLGSGGGGWSGGSSRSGGWGGSSGGGGFSGGGGSFGGGGASGRW